MNASTIRLNAENMFLDNITPKSSIRLLKARLADTIDLSLQAKQAQWNLTDSDVFYKHELFTSIYDEACKHADMLANRINDLGGQADATPYSIVIKSRLTRYFSNVKSKNDYLVALVRSMNRYKNSLKNAEKEADRFGDNITSTIFSKMINTNKRLLWFVEANRENI